MRVVLLAWLFVGGIYTRTALYGQSPLPAAPRTPISFSDTVNILPSNIAFTKCSGSGPRARAITWINTELLSTDSARAILIHEAVHKIQAERWPTCHDWEVARDTNAVQMVMEEVEAHCASLVLDNDPHRKRMEYAARLMRAYAGLVSPVVISTMFEDYCQPAEPGPPPNDPRWKGGQ